MNIKNMWSFFFNGEKCAKIYTIYPEPDGGTAVSWGAETPALSKSDRQCFFV